MLIMYTKKESLRVIQLWTDSEENNSLMSAQAQAAQLPRLTHSESERDDGRGHVIAHDCMRLKTKRKPAFRRERELRLYACCANVTGNLTDGGRDTTADPREALDDE